MCWSESTVNENDSLHWGDPVNSCLHTGFGFPAQRYHVEMQFFWDEQMVLMLLELNTQASADWAEGPAHTNQARAGAATSLPALPIPRAPVSSTGRFQLSDSSQHWEIPVL